VHLVRDADVFLLPTDADAHSVACVEAMAMGLPVVSTRVGGIVDIVDEGTTGYLVEPRDLASLADRLRRLRDRELRLRLGAASRQRAEALFDNAKIAATVVETLKHAAGKARRASASRSLRRDLAEG
jgi:glycosyltransferase involved in cell wall biosynthesis